MGETRVDLLHLLEDLRDAYPGALEETILTAALSLAPLAVEPAREHDFVTAFLGRWGEGLGRAAPRGRASR